MAPKGHPQRMNELNDQSRCLICTNYDVQNPPVNRTLKSVRQKRTPSKNLFQGIFNKEFNIWGILNKADLLEIFPKIGVHHLILNLFLPNLEKVKALEANSERCPKGHHYFG